MAETFNPETEEYTWKIAPGVTTRVDYERALRLANAGEQVDPNPFWDREKYPESFKRRYW